MVFRRNLRGGGKTKGSLKKTFYYRQMSKSGGGVSDSYVQAQILLVGAGQRALLTKNINCFSVFLETFFM